MRVALTGGGGFIGSACLVELLRRGDEVVVVDNFESTLYERSIKEDNLAWAREHGDFELHEVDIRHRDGMVRVLDAAAPDIVVHMAAVAGVRPSISRASLYFDINVVGTAQLLALSRERGVTDFVLASSSSVYGGNTKTPFAEEDPVDNPISPYAASKRAMELLAWTDHHLHGGNVTCLRFFTVYGPRQRPEMAFHKFMRLIARGEDVPMFGDGSSGRDYTFIDDIVRGVMSSIDRRGGGFATYNLGGDRVVLLRDAIEALTRVIGKPAHVVGMPMQPGDVSLTWADLTRARGDLGYEPRTDLDQGLAAMWAWYQDIR